VSATTFTIGDGVIAGAGTKNSVERASRTVLAGLSRDEMGKQIEGYMALRRLPRLASAMWRR